MDIYIDRAVFKKAFDMLPPASKSQINSKTKFQESVFEIPEESSSKSPNLKLNNIIWFIQRQLLPPKQKQPTGLSSDNLKRWWQSAGIDKVIAAQLAEKLVEKLAAQKIFPDGTLLESKPVYRLENEVDLSSSEGYGFVYFIRNKDLHKIGLTENLLRRMNELTPDEVLNVVRCTNFAELELMLHKEFRETRIPQTEYFRFDEQQIQAVHKLMIKNAAF